MVRFQQADPEAPGALIGALSPALMRFFRSQFAIREQADDLLQETWLRIHRVCHTYRPGEPVLPWFYAIAANETRAMARRAKPSVDVDTTRDPALAAPGDPEHGAIEAELRAALARAVESLDAQAAEAIAVVLGEAARPEIADAAFRKRVSRAYARLRVLLGGHGEH